MALELLPLDAQDEISVICKDVGLSPKALLGSRVTDRGVLAVRAQCWLHLRWGCGIRPSLIARAFAVSSPAVTRATLRSTDVHIKLGPDVYKKFEQQAKARSIPVEILVLRLLNTISRDGIFAAVLDDGTA